MRSAEITELASPPVVAERRDPRPADGQLVLDVAAVALNPVDIAIAAGTFYAGHPPLAYIPAIEAAGWVGDRFVYAQGSGRGVATDGFLAERAVVTEADLVELPDGTDPALAAALGIAGATGWLATTTRAEVGPGDIVVVLGATGAVGGIAVQAAKRCGASAVIAVGRDEARLAAVPGADARIAIGPTLGEEVRRGRRPADGGDRHAVGRSTGVGAPGAGAARGSSTWAPRPAPSCRCRRPRSAASSSTCSGTPDSASRAPCSPTATASSSTSSSPARS